MLTSRSRRLLTAMAVAAGVALVPVATADAASSTITACVKTRTGAVKVLPAKKVKSKCSKGWKKFTWNTAGKPGKNGTNGATGATGATGPAGPQLNVKDANGAVIGEYAGLNFIVGGSTIPFFQVNFQGGLYVYYPSGQLIPINQADVNYKTVDCTGPAYFQASAGILPLLLGMVGGPTRFTSRTLTPPFTFGPTTAWKFTSTTETVSSKQLYIRQQNGTCATDGGVYTGGLMLLEETPAPPDGVGPLTIG